MNFISAKKEFFLSFNYFSCGIVYCRALAINPSMMYTFIQNDDIEWEILEDKVRRKILSYDPSLMLVKVAFQAGAIGQVHQHEHVQISYVESGIFEIEIDQQKQILQKGDVFHVPSNVLHGARCIEDGVLIDAFSPMRADFIP